MYPEIYPEVWFPKLNIQFEQLDDVAFTLFNVPVYWYGIFIACAFLAGMTVATINAKRFGFDKNFYQDIIIYVMIFAILGARIYYVAFDFDAYKDDLLSVFNLRQGGLAVYGGVIGAFLASFIYCKKKNYNFFRYADLAMPGLLIGQAIGRWGNFFNKEAFGGPSTGLFQMAIREDAAKYIPDGIEITKFAPDDLVGYIIVQPTFLYESFWNICTCIFLYWFCKKRKFDGQIFFLYFIIYGIGRFFIESQRTDQLLIGGIPISMILSAVFIVLGIILSIIFNNKEKEQGTFKKYGNQEEQFDNTKEA